jgi:tetratricopeptide (TPR) repeat protein
LKETIRLDPTLTRAHFNLGNALNKKIDPDGAIICFREEIRLNPAFAPAHNLLAVLLTRRGEPRAALEVLRQGARANAAWLAEPASGVRYNSACCACLAAAGRGTDAPPMSERPALRTPALDWLAADLTAWRNRVAADPARYRAVVHRQMAHWLTDPDLGSVRELAESENLPADERADWVKLWAGVRDFRDATAPPAGASLRPPK